MYREGKTINTYKNGKWTSMNRPKSNKEIEETISNLKWQIKHYEQIKEKSECDTSHLDILIEKDKRIISRLEKELELNKTTQNHKLTKKYTKRGKKINKEKAKQLIIKYLKQECQKCRAVSVEEVVNSLNIRQSIVSQIFHELNLEGILSQKYRNFVHDTNRHPIFPMPNSGWAPNIYYINKEKLC